MSDKVVILQVKTGTKAPDSSLTQKLGSNQINPRMFFEKFESVSAKLDKNVLVGVHVVVKEKNNFDIIMKGPIITSRIKQLLAIEKGSSTPNLHTVGTLTDAQVTQIAKEKLPFSNAFDLEKEKNTVKSVAKNMGVQCQ